jgi:hypothetical protein
MEKSNPEKKYQQWQINFIYKYFSLSYSARNRMCSSENLFIKKMSDEDWEYFIKKSSRFTLSPDWYKEMDKFMTGGIKWIRIKLRA